MRERLIIGNWWEEMEQRLYDAAVAGDVTSLARLIQEDPLLLDKASLNCQDKNPLHIAVLLGHVGFVKAILRDNSDLCFVPDRCGRNPLHLAAIKGRLDVLQELIHTRPLAAGEKTVGGDTVLHLCIKHNQLEALRNLVEAIQGHEFANMKNGDGMTVLHLVICNEQNDAIEYLLQNNKVDVNAKNANGKTALDLFQGDTNSEIARSLKSAGAKRAKEIDAPKKVEWLTQKRDAIMVVASLIATMTFQAGVNPPGGVWQDNSKGPNDSEPHMAGEAVMAHNHSAEYQFFVRANTVAFVSSLSIILLLISGLPFRRYKFFMWVLMVVMWMTISAAALTYVISILLLVPPSNMNQSLDVVTYAVGAWGAVMAVLLLGNTIRLLKWWIKFLLLLLWNTIRLLMRCLKFILQLLGNAIRHLLNKIKHGDRAVQEQSNDMQENIQMSSV